MWPLVEIKQQVGECWACVIFFPRLPQGGNSPHFMLCQAQQGVCRGVVAPQHGVQGSAPLNFFGPYIRWADISMVLCMDSAHGFGHDDFCPWYFVDPIKGTKVMF